MFVRQPSPASYTAAMLLRTLMMVSKSSAAIDREAPCYLASLHGFAGRQPVEHILH